MTATALRIEDDGPVVRLTLDRPARRNAFDAGLIAELTEALRAAPGRPGARCVVLTGAGAAFSAGGDLRWMAASLELSPDENHADALGLAELYALVRSLPLPVVARVQGPAIGGGAGLVCTADVAVAADDATIGFPEVRLGLVPATITPHVVERIGDGAARALFLTGRIVDAHEALRLGLVHRVVPAQELDAAVAAAVDDLLAGGPGALAETKRLLLDLPLLVPAAAAATTAARLAAARRRPEAQAGVRAFLARERPPWR